MSETKPTARALIARAAEYIHIRWHAENLVPLGKPSGVLPAEVMAEIIETNLTELLADSKKLREPAVCNAGHKSNLPLALWDCPVCTQLLRDKLKKVEELVWQSKSLVAGFQACMRHTGSSEEMIEIRLAPAEKAIRALESALGKAQ